MLEIKPGAICVCVCVSHRAPLTQAAQQQCRVRGHDAVLHVLPCMLQSWNQKEDDDEEEVVFYCGEPLHSLCSGTSYLCWGPAPLPHHPSSSSWHHLAYWSRCCHWQPTGSHRPSPATPHSGPAWPSEPPWWGHQSAPRPGWQPAPSGERAEEDGEEETWSDTWPEMKYDEVRWHKPVQERRWRSLGRCCHLHLHSVGWARWRRWAPPPSPSPSDNTCSWHCTPPGWWADPDPERNTDTPFTPPQSTATVTIDTSTPNTWRPPGGWLQYHSLAPPTYVSSSSALFELWELLQCLSVLLSH